jgi:predicted transcriptional regulator
MGKNRDRISIITNILKAANSGSCKTHIMFDANLSFRVLEKYLNAALNYGLINQEEFKYKVTDIGREYFEQYKHFEECYISAQKMLESLSCERERLARFCSTSNVDKSPNSLVERAGLSRN